MIHKEHGILLKGLAESSATPGWLETIQAAEVVILTFEFVSCAVNCHISQNFVFFSAEIIYFLLEQFPPTN